MGRFLLHLSGVLMGATSPYSDTELYLVYWPQTMATTAIGRMIYGDEINIYSPDGIWTRDATWEREITGIGWFTVSFVITEALNIS
jgi:hypothetical protein